MFGQEPIIIDCVLTSLEKVFSHATNHVASKYPQGGTQHIHIRGGKSDIFGSEYCEK